MNHVNRRGHAIADVNVTVGTHGHVPQHVTCAFAGKIVALDQMARAQVILEDGRAAFVRFAVAALSVFLLGCNI